MYRIVIKRNQPIFQVRSIARTILLRTSGRRGLPGATGPTGPAGADGAPGTPGAGVAPGGSTGQVLAKASNVDNDTHWVDPAPPASVEWGDIGGNLVDQTDLQTVLDTKISQEQAIAFAIALG